VRLANKACLVTGGGAGIGAAVVKLFRVKARKAFTVDVAAGDGVDFVADVADPDKAGDAVEAALRALGGLDVLVCNAAMRNYRAARRTRRPRNGRGRFRQPVRRGELLSRGPSGAEAIGDEGSVVLVSSVYAVTGRKGMGIYDATKAGLLAMTRTLAHEEAQHGIRVNAVCPGSDAHRVPSRPGEGRRQGRRAAQARA
jgi:meso-butanediol dehydrogenase/(S,S)-butanediol dehydrogenase/diacetyl reductase